MKTKTGTILILAAAFFMLTSCGRHDETKFGSLKEFYDDNGVAMQTFTFNSTVGGVFTTPQGTKVTIPADAFMLNFTPVSGTVSLEFKDLYKKSDLLLSGLTTETAGGGLLKSGGEFFIRAKIDGVGVQLIPGKNIDVEQPLFNDSLDFGMDAFIWPAGAEGWLADSSGSVTPTLSGYVFSLYSFSAPQDSGTWCNCDNPSFFGGAQVQLTLHPEEDPSQYNTDVFLVFNNVNSMVHVYRSGTDFPYLFAPAGYTCSVVAVAVKDSLLYSSFVPITIGSANQTVNFSLSPTSEEEFKDKLEELN